MISSRRSTTNASALTGWFKSSYSGGSNGECLEVARGHAAVPVRDSKAADGPAIVFSADGWSSFVTALKGGRLSA
ncbi:MULTISPECIES: DUF397 domain-containing protein [Streptomyces]|uniref:DUF397 domain-containing protein n=1 Tax=Streptomyces TaxID=1883 RepID=UPI0004C9B744|nr:MULTISPECIES: DUF397 domain-containing protein [Streptomyces]MDX2921029.1 DUF397 domain-containing protein [Streptomyces sp. NE06-03C]MDX3609884.1 DUF397 domain-containing protein [Streptomyces sp. FL06-04B]MDX3736125.1 DUF397 domain-containing protein [Streptomyces sp. ID01-15D]